jgi:dephospho-CoA kinase
MKVVAITGGFAAGKSTLARGLQNNLPGTWEVRHIASGVKRAAEGIFGVPITPENKSLYRPLLQAMADLNIGLGNPERWIDRLISSWESDAQVILDDVRFRYELDYLHKLRNFDVDMVHLHVLVPEHVRIARHTNTYGVRPTEAQLRHPSETDLYINGRNGDNGIYSPYNGRLYFVNGTLSPWDAAEDAARKALRGLYMETTTVLGTLG